MELNFDKNKWMKVAQDFPIPNIDVELMDKVKDYFFAFIDSPIDMYCGETISAYSKTYKSEEELIKYLKSQDKKGLILYCILLVGNTIILRSAKINGINGVNANDY